MNTNDATAKICWIPILWLVAMNHVQEVLSFDDPPHHQRKWKKKKTRGVAGGGVGGSSGAATLIRRKNSVHRKIWKLSTRTHRVDLLDRLDLWEATFGAVFFDAFFVLA